MAAPDRLTQDELSVVLRRAAELDIDTIDGADNGLSLATVEAAAAEVGLAPAAVRQAVAELRAGMLSGPAPEVLGDDVIVVARVVPGTVDSALGACDHFLTRQMLERVRDRGAARTYRQREDTLATLARAFDFRGGSKRLKSVYEVEAQAIEVEDGTLLRITARLKRGIAMAPRVAGLGTAVLAGGLVAAGTAALFDPDLLGLVGVPVGAATGAGSWNLARAVVHRERRRVAEVADGFLDELELGRQPHERSAIEKLRRQAARLRGPWV